MFDSPKGVLRESPYVCFNIVLLEDLQQLDLVQSKEVIFSFSLVNWHCDPTEGQSIRRWMDGQWEASVWASVCSFVLILWAVLHVFFTYTLSLASFFWTIFMEVWQPSRDHFIAIECHAKCAKLCKRESRWQTFPTTSVQWWRRAPILLFKKEFQRREIYILFPDGSVWHGRASCGGAAGKTQV